MYPRAGLPTWSHHAGGYDHSSGILLQTNKSIEDVESEEKKEKKLNVMYII